MALYIQSNAASMLAQESLSNTQNALGTTFARLSSGYRINSAADDAAGLGISESMNSQVQSYAVAERNANDGISMAQTADGAASQVQDMLTRMRELAVESSNGDLSANDRTNLNTEFQSVISEVDRVSNVTQFNGTNLLSGAATPVAFQVGIGTTTNDQVSVSFGGVSSTALGIPAATTDVTSVANAQAAITAIDAANQSLSTIREGFGSAMNRLQDSVSNLQSMSTNMTAALSNIKDVDVASETASLSQEQVLSQAGVAVLAQANQAPQLALKLLQ
jgi:flagellin